MPPSYLFTPTILGKYQLTRFLGNSSFAKVYQVCFLIDGAIVTVKIVNKSKTINANLEPRIVHEIDAMCHLYHHLNILKIHEVMATKTEIYLVIEFATGRKILSKINRHNKMTEPLRGESFNSLSLHSNYAIAVTLLTTTSIFCNLVAPYSFGI